MNDKTSFGQHSPEILALPGGLVVAWQDNKPGYSPTVCHRRFSAQLAPAGPAFCEPFDSTARTAIVLGEVGGALVRGWSELGGVRVAIDGAPSALLPFDGPGAPGLAAFTSVDSDHVLVVYTDNGGSQRAAVLNTQGQLSSLPLTLNPSGPERHDPALVTTSDGVYLSWSEPSGPVIDAGLGITQHELYLQRFVWDGSSLAASGPILPLPRRQSHRLGDQESPALAAHGDLLLAAWYDQTNDNYAGELSHGDVAIELIPTPILRKQGVE